MGNEFETLGDIVLSRGIKHSEIISEIHLMVFKEYATRYPDKLENADVVVNEKTGDVRIIANKVDVTPEEFAPIAKQIAMNVLINKLKNYEQEQSRYNRNHETEQPKQHSDGILHWILSFLFWLYNGFYILLISLYFLNFIFSGSFRSDMIIEFKDRDILASLLFIMVLAMPYLSVFLAYKLKDEKGKFQLSKIVFLFELPLVLILLIAIPVLENASLVMWFFFFTFLSVVIIVFLESIRAKINKIKQKWAVLSLKQMTLVSLIYLTMLYLFFGPAMIIMFIKDVFSEYGFRFYDVFELFFGLIYLLIIGLIFISPFAITYLFFLSFRKTYMELEKEIGKEKLNKALVFLTFAWIVVMFMVSYQPNTNVLEKLQSIKSAKTFEEKEQLSKEITKDKKKIDKQINNIANAREKYIFDKNFNEFESLYNNIGFHHSVSGLIQGAFNNLAYPFVYQGDFSSKYQIDESYEYVFGYKFGQDEASLINRGNVDLIYRKIEVNPDNSGYLAKVIVEEEYKNQTYSDQEVLYEFSLPDNSAVVDLKLGPDLEFEGIIAPRGAAGKVYEKEMTRKRDPALLEQTGPRQYRLRVFPVPRKNDRTTLNGKNQRVKFSYITELRPNGYALPSYSKIQNIKVNESSNISYYFNGKPVGPADKDRYVKSDFDLKKIDLCQNVNSQIFKNDNNLILAEVNKNTSYKCNNETGINLTNSLRGKKFAILYDVSYKNFGNSFMEDFVKILRSNESIINNNKIDLYLFNNILSGKKSVNSQKLDDLLNIGYFGKGNWLSHIKSVEGGYDFIVIVTANNEINSDISRLELENNIPIYLIHKDDKVPPYPNYVSNYILQNNGKVAADFNDAITSYILSEEENLISIFASKNIHYGSYQNISIPYYTIINEAKILLEKFDIKKEEKDLMVQFINKAFMTYIISAHNNDINKNVSLMDNLDEFAKKNQIVSQYSSLIALVNSQQLKDLERETKSGDRYSYETLQGQNLNRGNDTNNSTSGWNLPLSPSKSIDSGPVEGWGFENPPANVPIDVFAGIFNIINWFISLNVVLIIVGAIIYSVKKYKGKRAKKIVKKDDNKQNNIF